MPPRIVCAFGFDLFAQFGGHADEVLAGSVRIARAEDQALADIGMFGDRHQPVQWIDADDVAHPVVGEAEPALGIGRGDAGEQAVAQAAGGERFQQASPRPG